MKFINIMGPVDDIERVKLQYLSRYDIQPEDAAREMGETKILERFDETSPFTDLLVKAERCAKIVGADNPVDFGMDKETAIGIINKFSFMDEEHKARQAQLEIEKKQLIALTEQIEPFLSLDFNFEELLKLKYVHFRFGKMPRASFLQFETYLYDQPDILFEEGYHDNEYTWGIYLVPKQKRERVDAIFTSSHFEQIRLPKEIVGTLKQSYDNMKERLDMINKLFAESDAKLKELMIESKDDIAAAWHIISEMDSYFKMKKYMGHTKEGFFIFVGWMKEKDAAKLAIDVKDDDKVILTVGDEAGRPKSTPPTSLKNPLIFRPFEFFVRMYGLPSYSEMDPTPFIAITYSILFGLMFGDVGQGLVMSLLGFLLHKVKGMQLGAIFCVVGLFSTFFGFMYGSVFGFEDLIEPLWMNPMHNMNNILIVSVGIGVGLIIIAMLLNIINAIRSGNFGKAFFDNSGLAGLVFYGTVIVCAILVVTGKNLPATWILSILLIMPFVLIALKEPLTNLIQRKRKLIHGKSGDFILETVFEMFEVLLSYLTNTISFVRVGAFALSHAGMMSVVLMLGGVEKGEPNIIVIILGNILVMAMEGLVVGIQVLRLEYYEMFSRFYESKGREFTPVSGNKNRKKKSVKDKF